MEGCCKSLKILIANSDGSQSRAFAAQLQAQQDDFDVTSVGAGEDLLAAVQRVAPDFVIVDMARPDRDGLDSLRALSTRQMLPVVMFVDDDDPAFMEEAISAGVSSYHVYDVALPSIKPILRIAMAYFKRSRDLNSRLIEAEQQLNARQTIEAAKRLLMSKDNLSEPSAHRFLQRRAMDQQKKLIEVAAELLSSHGKRSAGP
jgi:response regulator NasT